MNTRADIALSHFVDDFDAFLVACADFERTGRWDVRKLGYMAAYFEADLFAVVLQVMSADGVFGRAEADVLNRMFSASYSPRELRDMYRQLRPVVDDYCDAEAADAVHTLARLDKGLCEQYRRLILEACKVVMMSDGVAEGEERVLLERLRIALEG